MKEKEFSIIMDNNYYLSKDILNVNSYQKVEVLQDPHRKWYKILLQWITFGYYKAPWQYKVKVL